MQSAPPNRCGYFVFDTTGDSQASADVNDKTHTLLFQTQSYSLFY